MDNDFKRSPIPNKPGKVRAIFSSNKREQDRVQKINEKKLQERAYERLGLAGYTWTVFSVGLAIGLVFGGPVYDWIVAKQDNQLALDAKFYKEQYQELGTKNDSLRNVNDKLKTDNEALNNQLTEEIDERNSLQEALLAVQQELDQKYVQLDSNQKSNPYTNFDETEIAEYNSSSFFNGKLNVAVANMYGDSSIDIQISASGYDSIMKHASKVGSQYTYEAGKEQYQVRIIKVDIKNNIATVQATKLK